MTALIIADVEILQDPHGRYSLNTLHKASGAKHGKEPSRWLENKATQELITELAEQCTNSCFDVVKGGNAAGIYVHELLAISYAGWVSPAFQLKVNQAFLATRTKSTQPRFHNPMSQVMIDMVMRVDALEYEVAVQKQENTRLSASLDRVDVKANLALEDAHRMTVEEFVLKNGLHRQFPPPSYGRISAWLKDYCQRYGMLARKAPVLGKSWDEENNYPIGAIGAFLRYETTKPRQITLVKEEAE